MPLRALGRGTHHDRAVLAGAEEELVAQFPCGMDRLEVIGTAIGDIDPAGPLGCRPDAADAAFPQLRLAVAVQPLGAGLPLGGGGAGGHLLVGQPQDLLSLGDDRQAVVLQEPPTDAIAHGAGAGQGAMGGEVQLGGVVDHEDGCGDLRHLGPCPLEMSGGDGGVSDFGSVAEAIDGAKWVPGEVLRQGPFGSFGQPLGTRDEPSGPPFVPQSGVLKVRFRPGARGGERIGCHGDRSLS